MDVTKMEKMALALMIAGFVGLMAGVAMWSVPAAFATGGALLMITGIALDRVASRTVKAR